MTVKRWKFLGSVFFCTHSEGTVGNRELVVSRGSGSGGEELMAPGPVSRAEINNKK